MIMYINQHDIAHKSVWYIVH